MGNTKLVQYGIWDEKAEFRIHVGVETAMAYLYRTQDMRDLLLNAERADHPYRVRSVWTPINGNGIKIETARGYIVPVRDIPNIVTAEIDVTTLADHDLLDELFGKEMNTSELGRHATEIANELLETGKLHLPLAGRLVVDAKTQIDGHDLIRDPNGHTFQVKCDFTGGYRERGGTGNLFIQTHECNPLNQH